MSEATATPELNLEDGSLDDVVNQLDAAGVGDLSDIENALPEAKEPEEKKPEGEEETDKVEDADEEDKSDEEAPDEQFVTYEGEDGKEVEISLTELLESHGGNNELKTRNAELEQNATRMPEQIRTVLTDQSNKLGELVNMFEMASEFFNGNGEEVPMPNDDLLNEGSMNYDPQKYQEGLQSRTAQMKQRAEMNETLQSLLSQRQQVNQKLHEDYLTEQVGIVNQFWPELSSDKAEFGKVRSLLTEYGYSDAEVNNIADSRQFKIIKDLIGLKSKGETSDNNAKKAMKIIANNPKLTKRSAKAPTQTNNDKAMSRLTKTGSDEDAVAALMNLELH